MSTPGPLRRRPPQGLPLRTITPNALTALALCSGLTGVRFAIAAASDPAVGGAIDTGPWELAVIMILIASALDGVDGQVARLLRGTSRFGAELDSLSDAISFGVAPALILYLWSLTHSPKFGWACALLFAVFCALRLARFNAAIDSTDQPRKAAGYFTGIPAPAGAIGAMLPMYLWFITGNDLFRSPWLVAPWVALMAILMVSSVATFGWSSVRLRRRIRFEALVVIVAVGALLIAATWQTLAVVCVAYLATIPFSIVGYARVRRLRANLSAAPPA